MNIDNILNNLSLLTEEIFSVSETYRYLFLLYVSFLGSVLIINIISLLYKSFLEWRLSRLERKLKASLN